MKKQAKIFVEIEKPYYFDCKRVVTKSLIDLASKEVILYFHAVFDDAVGTDILQRMSLLSI